MRITPEVLRALHSLKEDATHAYHRALEGEDGFLPELGRTMRQVEQAVINADRPPLDNPDTSTIKIG